MMRVLQTIVSPVALAIGLVGLPASCSAGPDDPPPAKVEFRHAQDDAAPGFTKRKIEGTTDTVYVQDNAGFVPTPDDISEARAAIDERMKHAILVRFTEPGSEKMGLLTGGWVGKRLAFLVDGKVISSRPLNAKITDVAMITGEFTEFEVDRIARSLHGS